MSKLTEMAEAEAQRAEAEDETGEGGGTDEEEAAATEEEETPATEEESPPEDPESEPVAPVATGPTPAQLQALDRENTRHEKRAREIMGDDARFFAACPICQGMGLAPVPIPPPESPLKSDQTVVQCETCGGHGYLDTPSLNPKFSQVECVDCATRGIVPKPLPAMPTQAQTSAPVQIPPMPQYDPTANVWRDQFGNVIGGIGGNSAPVAVTT
jgi:hypothetical protein